MAKRTFTDSKAGVWEWQETPETVEALKQLHNSVVNNRVTPPHDYQGPLYAPHPDIQKDS